MMEEEIFRDILLAAWVSNEDPAHDLGHIQRVVNNTKLIAEKEGGDLAILIPAAWLHDIVNLPKDHPDRQQCSRYAADEAIKHLKAVNFTGPLDAVHHAIIAHSFSANITPVTLEAKILQDADRLDALGAIGLARMFAVSGQLGRTLFHSEDPLAKFRMPDDTLFSLDHIKVKLVKIAETLHTQTAKVLAKERLNFMLNFAQQIAIENNSLQK